MASETTNDMENPDELIDELQNFRDSLDKMTETLRPLYTLNFNSSDYQLDPLDRARLNLVSGFAVNSLFWMYLTTLGIDPKEHKIKSELDRYKSVHSHIKEITDKAKAPVLDKGAAGRFIKHALWERKDTESDSDATSSREVEQERQTVKQERTSPERQSYKKKRRY